MVGIGPRNLETHSGDCSAEAESLQSVFLLGVWFTNEIFPPVFQLFFSAKLLTLQTSDPFEWLLCSSLPSTGLGLAPLAYSC